MRKSSFSSNATHMVFSYACSKAEEVQKHHPAKLRQESQAQNDDKHSINAVHENFLIFF